MIAIWLLGWGGWWVAQVFQETTLTCERQVTDGPVNCSVQRTAFSILPLGQSEISDVRGANVSEFVDQDGDLSFYVELQTPNGVFALTRQIPGPGTRQREHVASINSFVRSTAPGTISLSEDIWSGLPTQQP